MRAHQNTDNTVFDTPSHYAGNNLSGFFLLCSHASLNNIYNIVAKLFTLAYYIHIHRTNGIRVLMVVHVVDVLALQLVAIIINLVLDIERTINVKIVFASGKHHIHLTETVVCKLKHLMQMLILLFCKVLFAPYLAVYCPRHVVTAVADTLYLGYLS